MEIGEIDVDKKSNGEAANITYSVSAQIADQLAQEIQCDKNQIAHKYESTVIDLKNIAGSNGNNVSITSGLYTDSSNGTNSILPFQQFHQMHPTKGVDKFYVARKKADCIKIAKPKGILEVLDPKDVGERGITGLHYGNFSTRRYHRRMYTKEVRKVLIQKQETEDDKITVTKLFKIFQEKDNKPLSTDYLETAVGRNNINYILNQFCEFNTGGKFKGKWNIKIHFILLPKCY